eukprot:sb/3471100/
MAAANKDNDFIYHERIPSHADLGAIGRAPVAKPTALPTTVEGWSDVFTKLVPLNVQQAATMYSSRRDHLVHMEVNKLKEATNQLNGVLNQMNMPAALEDLTGKEIPVSLLEKSADQRSKGGLMLLRQMFDELPQLLQRNEEILRESDHYQSLFFFLSGKTFKPKFIKAICSSDIYRPPAQGSTNVACTPP